MHARCIAHTIIIMYAVSQVNMRALHDGHYVIPQTRCGGRGPHQVHGALHIATGLRPPGQQEVQHEDPNDDGDCPSGRILVEFHRHSRYLAEEDAAQADGQDEDLEKSISQSVITPVCHMYV